MSEDARIEQARRYFEAGSYADALRTCTELIKEKTEISKASLIAAKSMIFAHTDVPDDDTQKTIATSVSNACGYAESIEEAQQIEEEIYATFDIWHRQRVEADLQSLERNPTLDNWKTYFPKAPKYIMFNIMLMIASRNNKVVDEYCASQGIEKKEYGERRGTVQRQELSSEEEHQMLFDTAMRIYPNTRANLEANNNGNGEFIKQVVQKYLNELLTVECMIKYSESDDLPPAVNNERLKAEAEVTTYTLNALVYPNGQPLSLLSGDR